MRQSNNSQLNCKYKTYCNELNKQVRLAKMEYEKTIVVKNYAIS